MPACASLVLSIVPAPAVAMLFCLLAQALSDLLDLILLRSSSSHDKDVEILLLRQQPRILQRKQPRAARISRWEKLILLVLVGNLTGLTTSARMRLSQLVLLVKPDKFLKWHRELVRRTWTFTQR